MGRTLLWLSGVGLFLLTLIMGGVLMLAPALPYDGQQVAYITFRDSAHHIARFDLLRNAEIVLPVTNLAPSSLSWSPDGRLLAVTGGVSGRDLYTIDVETLAVRQIDALGGRDQYPMFSPDGDWIAFVSSSDANPRTEQAALYIVPATGGTPRRLVERVTGNFRVAWSPAGDRIAFISDLFQRNGVYTVEIETGAVTLLTDEIAAGRFQTVYWQADGLYVVADLDQPNAYNHRLYRLADETVTPLTPAWYHIHADAIALSPYNTMLFVADGARAWASVMHLDDGTVRPISAIDSPVISPVWRP
jgi:Tol biopolymer transport system component